MNCVKTSQSEQPPISTLVGSWDKTHRVDLDGGKRSSIPSLILCGLDHRQSLFYNISCRLPCEALRHRLQNWCSRPRSTGTHSQSRCLHHSWRDLDCWTEMTHQTKDCWQCDRRFDSTRKPTFPRVLQVDGKRMTTCLANMVSLCQTLNFWQCYICLMPCSSSIPSFSIN